MLFAMHRVQQKIGFAQKDWKWLPNSADLKPIEKIVKKGFLGDK